jgi:hypothetical protein
MRFAPSRFRPSGDPSNLFGIFRIASVENACD